MIPRTVVQKILEESVQAPSGENAQPWRFGLENDKIYVFNIPERDQSPYNFRQRASFVANGALIENISIVSSAVGIIPDIKFFPDTNNPSLVAIVTLKEGKTIEHPLYPFIAQRTTNRKPYGPAPLTDEEKRTILDLAGAGAHIALTERQEDVVALGHVGGMNERVVFENRFLHDFLFSHINWTDEENEEKKIGFDIRTLELPAPARAAFKIFRHWGAVNAFNKLGLSKAIGKQNGANYSSAAAVIAIAVDGDRDEDFVRAGRAVQKVWLTATQLGLSVQPMAGILFFMQRILSDVNEPFSGQQVALIKEAYEKIVTIFGFQGKTIPMMFRIGHAEPPSARSLKLPPEIIDMSH